MEIVRNNIRGHKIDFNGVAWSKNREAKDFVKDGNLELGGRLPINTNGGQLGEAYIHGMNGIAITPDGQITGAACWRADGAAVGIGGGNARDGVRYWPERPRF